jgi:hypothetical protein
MPIRQFLADERSLNPKDLNAIGKAFAARIFGPMDKPCLNDAKPWSAADDSVLRASVAGGVGLIEAAAVLSRSGTPFEVYRRGVKLGLWRGREEPRQRR